MVIYQLHCVNIDDWIVCEKVLWGRLWKNASKIWKDWGFWRDARKRKETNFIWNCWSGSCSYRKRVQFPILCLKCSSGMCDLTRKILRSILKWYPYKISFVQQLNPAGPEKLLNFSTNFLARIIIENEWPQNILWSNEAHFLPSTEE